MAKAYISQFVMLIKCLGYKNVCLQAANYKDAEMHSVRRNIVCSRRIVQVYIKTVGLIV